MDLSFEERFGNVAIFRIFDLASPAMPSRDAATPRIITHHHTSERIDANNICLIDLILNTRWTVGVATAVPDR